MKKDIIIAIDGPSGVGKSTVSREVARRLSLTYVDTGAMYRALAVCADFNGVSIDDETGLDDFLSTVQITYDGGSATVSCNGRDLTREIREPHVGGLTSKLSSNPSVRRLLVDLQRASFTGGVVMEGRDIGTVVLPDADVKIYLDARPEVRAARRHNEESAAVAGKGKGDSVGDVAAVAREIKERDRRDSTRKDSPLKVAEDGVVVDTSDITIEEVIESVLKVAESVSR